MKHAYIFAGWFSVALGVIGMILPVMPTTCFMILAAFCFSKGSPRLHQLLRGCPKFGPVICDWEDHHVIGLHAKIMATALMSLSLVALLVFAVSWIWFLLVFVVIAAVCGFIWSCPSKPEGVGLTAVQSVSLNR